jgi:hypothetical protein
VAGELVPHPRLTGEILGPENPPPGNGGGSVYADFAKRLRRYVAPPPPGELGWRAVGGAGMTEMSAGLLALLPARGTIASSGLFKWVDRSGLAATMASAGRLVTPLALFGMVVLLGIAAIYLTRWGETPALMFLTAQTWLGVAALAIAVLAWAYLLFMLVLNLAIWAFVIAAVAALGMLALRVLGLFLES